MRQPANRSCALCPQNEPATRARICCDGTTGAGQRQVLVAVILALLPCLVSAQAPPNRANLIRELQLPPVALNLNLSFDPADLRIPLAGNPEEEIRKLQGQLAINDRADLHLQLARLLMQVGETQRGLDEYVAAGLGFQKQLQADARNAAAYVGLAEALMALGDDEGAAQAIEECLVLNDKIWKAYELSADLHARHAVIAFNQGMPEVMSEHLAAAEEAAREAVALAPDDPHPYVMLFLAKWLPAVFELHRNPPAGLANLPKFEEMSEILKKAADRAPHYPRLRQFAIACKMAPFFTAQMLKGLETGIWKDLDQSQQRVLRSCRDEFFALANEAPAYRATALLFTGVASFMMDERPAAYEYLAASTSADPQNTTALEIALAFLMAERKWPQALEQAEELKRRRPSGKAYTWLGRIYAEQGKLKQAEEAFRAAVDVADSPALANLGLGVVLLRQGANPLDALIPLRRAWELASDEPEAAIAWIVVLALVGEVAEARRILAEAQKLWPGNEAFTRLAAELK